MKRLIVVRPQADTIPTDAASYLGITSLGIAPLGSVAIVRWSSVSDRSYSLYVTSNSVDGLEVLLDRHIIGTPPEIAYTDAVDGVHRRNYVVEVELQP